MTNQPTNENKPRGSHARSAAPESSVPASDFATEQKKTPDGSFDLGGEVLIRKKRRTHAKRNRRLKIAACVVVALAVVMGGAAFAVHSMLKAGEEALHEASQAEDIQTQDTAETYDQGHTVTYNGHTYKLNENMVSVVVIGYDRETPAEGNEAAGQADAVMVLAMDTETGKISGIGVPRDSMVDTELWAGSVYAGQSKMQLCLAFAYGDGGEKSCQNVTTAVSRALYNMPMTYYFAIDLSGVGPLNDAIGGVGLTPLQTIPDTDIVEGQQTILRGDEALRYVRWRDTSVFTSSLDRQARQVQYVKAFFAKAVAQAQGNVGMFVDLYNTASEYSITNLGLNEYSYLASSVLGTGVSDLSVTTLGGEDQMGDVYVEYILDTESVYQTVLDVYYTQID